MLDNIRVLEMWWLFARVLPLDEADLKNAGELFGVNFAKLLPETCNTLGNECSKNLESFDMYLTFIIQAINYMRKETNEQPIIDHNQEEIQKQMRESIARKT